MYDNEIFTPVGRRFIFSTEHDADMGPPWKEHDGHGIVSDWTARDKHPGELVLASDHGSKRFYDFAATVKSAKRDGWDCEPFGQGTKGQQAVRAVMADFNRMRGWCNDVWSWIGVIVQQVDDEDEKIGTPASLWGIESDAGDYLDTVALELAADIIAESDAALTALAATLGVPTPATA